MLKRKKYMIGLLVMALSISFANSNVVLAAHKSKSKTVASRNNDTGITGIDQNNITWSYEAGPDGTICIWQYDELSGKVEIPEKIDGFSVSRIKNEGLSRATKITSVKIPPTVKGIGEMAFFGCTSLSSIEIPASACEIDENAFENTPWLSNQRNSNPLVVVNNILIDGRDATGDIVIPSNVTIIGGCAFAGIDIEREYRYKSANLTSVKIPEGVKKIGRNAFGNSPNLTHVEIPFSVTEIGEYAFSECTIEIEVPNKAAQIGEMALGTNPNLINTTPTNSGNNITKTPSNQGNIPTVTQGWHKDGEHWNWLWSDGTKRTGWYNENGDWYYFYGNGQMAKDILDLGGGFKYYLKPNSVDGKAAMATGGQYIAGDWYYFNPVSDGYKGAMKKGWIYEGGNWFYFYSSGKMAHNTTINGYYVNSKGAWVK